MTLTWWSKGRCSGFQHRDAGQLYRFLAGQLAAGGGSPARETKPAAATAGRPTGVGGGRGEVSFCDTGERPQMEVSWSNRSECTGETGS